MVDVAVDLDPARLENFHAALMSRGREEANAEADGQRERDRRRLKEMYEEHRVLWIHHHARMAEEFAKLSAEHERKARALEQEVRT